MTDDPRISPGPTWEIREGDALERLREMPDESVHCVVTSPAYWGLRDYGTAEWVGGDEGCDHRSPTMREGRNEDHTKLAGSAATNAAQLLLAHRSVCGKCGAVKVDLQLGLEATPGEYVAKLVEVFREVRRVLRSDGTLWLNLSSSYAGAIIESHHAIIRPDLADAEYQQAMSCLWGRDVQAEHNLSPVSLTEGRTTGELSSEGVQEVWDPVHETHGTEARLLFPVVRPVGEPGPQKEQAGGGVQDLRGEVHEAQGGNEKDAAREPLLQPDVLVQPQPAGQPLPMGGRATRPHEPGRREVAEGGDATRHEALPDMSRELETGSASYPAVLNTQKRTLDGEQRRDPLPDMPPKVSGGGDGPRRDPVVHSVGSGGRLEITLPWSQIPGDVKHLFRSVAKWKPKDLVNTPAMVAEALRADGWWLRSDIIWCLSGGTKVYARTQKGEMPTTIKDLVRLDPSTVQLWNGERWTQALGWNQTTRPDVTAEVELRSGERIGCTPNHEWPTQRGNVRTDELKRGDVIGTTRLPEPAKLHAPAHIDEDMAWLIGLYLAEGSMDGEYVLSFAGHADEGAWRADRLALAVEPFGGTVRIHNGGTNVVVDCAPVAAIVRQYIHGRSAKTKGIKVRAWRHADSWLAALFDGYLHGDGHDDPHNDRWRLGFTRNDRLADDIRTLCARLGYTLTLKATTVTGFGKTWPAYRGEVRKTRTGHHNERPRSEVMAIRKSRARKFWDIGVTDAPNTFALASGVLTHNSKPNPMPESVTDRPTKAHEYVFLLTKSARYFYDAEAISEQGVLGPHVRDRASNFKKAGLVGNHTSGGSPTIISDGTRNKRTVWTITTKPYSEAHFATFPPELPRICIKAGTSETGCCVECGAPWERVVAAPTGGQTGASWHDHTNDAETGNNKSIGGEAWKTYERGKTTGWQPTCDHEAETVPCMVLDPFTGAGTTGVEALALGRSFIGIELNPEYVKMARDRIDGDCPLFNREAS